MLGQDTSIAGTGSQADEDVMKIVSVNTGLPRDVVWHGRTVTTSIYKNPGMESFIALPLRPNL